MFSYWEQQSFLTYDHIIIGAGITGLSAAIELATVYPGQKILVLERGLMPSGASTRNAGFACMGSVTELLADLQTAREKDVVNLFAQRKQGLKLLRERLGDERIGYAENGSYELIDKNAKKALNKIDYLNDLLLPVNNKPSFVLANKKIKEFGFAAKFTEALIENTCEGELHTGKMMRALIHYALQAGVEIKTGANVVRYDEGIKAVTAIVHDVTNSENYLLKSKTLTLCTNAYTPELMKGVDVVPGRGQVLITKPVKGLKFKGIFHMDEGFYYFREIDGRVMIGGGRNTDFAGERTTDNSVTEKIQNRLEYKLDNVVLPGIKYEVESRWAGIMAFGRDKKPIIKAFSKRVFGAFRMGGMGVALGSEAGRQLAEVHIQNRID